MCKRLTYLVALVLVLALVGGAWADLVGHWSFDEGAGTVAADSSGNGNDGALEDGPTVVDGQFGKALAFDGSRVAIGASDSLTADLFQGSFTLVAWLNPKRTGNTWQQVFRSVATSFNNDTLFINNDGRLSWRGTVNGGWAGGMCETAPDVVPADQWTHAAVVGDGTNFRIYVNGALSQESAFQTTDGANATYYIGGDPTATGESYAGMADEVAVFDHALTEAEVKAAMQGISGAELAASPSPEDATIDVPRDVVLGWEAGEFAATHDVYLGTAFDDVNDADRGNPMGVLVSEGQAAASYDPDGLLDFGLTYYWRIDEVNAAPDNTIFKGGVWSFTTEPFSYAIEGVVATSNGTPQADADPENMVNGSGLNENDEHSTAAPDMWLASPVGDEPLTIEFELDRVYKMHEMLIWNYNVQFELLLGFGIKDVTVEYSENGIDWAVLGDAELAQGTARADYTANTAIDLQGVAAQFVKLTVNAGFGMMGQFGLSEVRFMQIPAHAREPQPDDGATDVSVATDLAWRAGRDAISHEVNFGTDPNALALVDSVDAPSFDPGTLDLGTTYYWKIDAVQEVDSWEGSLWSFGTQEFLVVDDFESYTDDEGSRIYETWIDGYGVADNGSTVGHLEAPFAETTIIHGGAQSMPLFYDNTGTAISEAELALAQNWTTSGIQSLSLYFQGAAGNGGQLYVKINGTKVAYDGAAADITEAMWLPWNIELSAIGGNVSNVTSLIVGIEGAGAAGVVYIDDIRLYPLVPEFVVPTEPDEANLVAHYAFESDFSDSAGSHHGAAMGDAHIASDPARGQVLSLDGGADAVEIPYSAELNPEAFTASLWANPDPAGSGHRSPITSRDDGPQRGYIIYLEPGNTWQFWTGTGAGWNNTGGPAATLGEWTHLAATFADENKAFYVNGRLVGQGTATLGLNTAQPLRIGAGASEGPGNYFFQGMLDEARVYDRALSDEEVAGLAGRTEPLHKPF